MYLGGTTRRYLQTASSSSMMTLCAANWLMRDYSQRVKSSTASPSQNVRSSYSHYSCCAFAFFVRSNPTRMALRASQASLVESFDPNSSRYSGGTAARVTSSAEQSSSSSSVPWSTAF